MTLGEERVRLSFNPSADSTVEKIKRLSADLIDLCNGLMSDESEKNRLLSLAMTDFEDAAMWAVKAATFKK